MSRDASARPKPGRKSTVAAHSQREAIEAACAAGISVRRVAMRFGLSPSAVDRHWRGLSPEYRAALASAAADQDDARWREVSAGLAAIARRHPEARADLDALAARIGAVRPAATGTHAHAA